MCNRSRRIAGVAISATPSFVNAVKPSLTVSSPVFLEVIFCPQFSFLLLTLTGEITFPAWAEIDMPTPELT